MGMVALTPERLPLEQGMTVHVSSAYGLPVPCTDEMTTVVHNGVNMDRSMNGK